jgi:hypothetical protein
MNINLQRSIWMSAIASIVLVGMLSACGDSTDPNVDPAAPEEPVASPEPSPTYGFADYDYIEVTPDKCTESQRLGNARSVTLKITAPPAGVAGFFHPNCLTDVKSDRVKVTVVNDTPDLHNFIVEGDDIELLVAPEERGSIMVDLTQDREIDSRAPSTRNSCMERSSGDRSASATKVVFELSIGCQSPMK